MVEAVTTRTRLAPEKRKAIILDEAVRIIGEKGFSAFSVSQLARRSGVTDAGLLHHFGSKSELLVAVLRRSDALDEEAVSLALRSAGVDQVQDANVARAVLRQIVSRNAQQAELLRLRVMLRTEALMTDHPAHLFFVQREVATKEMFREMFANFADDPLSCARQVIASMQGLEIQWVRELQGFDLTAEWEKVAQKLLP